MPTYVIHPAAIAQPPITCHFDATKQVHLPISEIVQLLDGAVNYAVHCVDGGSRVLLWDPDSRDPVNGVFARSNVSARGRVIDMPLALLPPEDRLLLPPPSRPLPARATASMPAPAKRKRRAISTLQGCVGS